MNAAAEPTTTRSSTTTPATRRQLSGRRGAFEEVLEDLDLGSVMTNKQLLLGVTSAYLILSMAVKRKNVPKNIFLVLKVDQNLLNSR